MNITIKQALWSLLIYAMAILVLECSVNIRHKSVLKIKLLQTTKNAYDENYNLVQAYIYFLYKEQRSALLEYIMNLENTPNSVWEYVNYYIAIIYTLTWLAPSLRKDNAILSSCITQVLEDKDIATVIKLPLNAILDRYGLKLASKP